MESRTLLDKWDGIPDLVIIARQNPKSRGLNTELPRLEKEFQKKKRAFQITRTTGARIFCSTKEHEQTASEKKIVHAKGAFIIVPGLLHHEIQYHGAAFPQELAAFLTDFPDSAPASNPRPLLEKWSRIPDLFLIAAAAKGEDRYALLQKLEGEYRKARKVFQVTTVYRGYESCITLEHEFGMTTLELTNEKGESIKAAGNLKHDILDHNAPFPLDLAAFLKNLPD